MLLTLQQFQRAANLSVVLAQRWHDPVMAAIEEFRINTPARLSAFIAQVGHESQGFSRLNESLYYTDAERVARIFRSDFDLNKNRRIDPSEIEFARRYLRNPEKMANYVYANQGGNGNEASGDGWRFRGRGLIQISLRDNYLRCGRALGLDLIARPDLLLEYPHAARSAAWYFSANGCNELADKGNFLAVTRRINPPAQGQEDRESRYRVAKAVLCQ